MFSVLIGTALAAAAVKGFVHLCGHRITWRMALVLALIIAVCLLGSRPHDHHRSGDVSHLNVSPALAARSTARTLSAI